MGDHGVVHAKIDASIGDVDSNRVSIFDESDRATFRGFRRNVADREPRGSTAESPIGDQRADGAELLRLDVGGRVEHFLHARPALGAFVADQDDVAWFDLTAEYRVAGALLGVENARGSLEFPDRFIDTGGFYDTTVFGEIAIENREAALGAIGVFDRTDTAIFGIVIGLIEILVLGKRDRRAYAARRGERKLFGGFAGSFAADIVFVDGGAECLGMNRVNVSMNQTATIEFTQDREDATGTMHVFDVIFIDRGCDLADIGHFAREAIHVLHAEVDARFVCDSQDMQHGIRRTAHRDIERHRVLEGLEGGDAPWQDGRIAIEVVPIGQFDDELPRPFE